MSIDWNWGIFLQQAPFGNTTYLGWIWSGFQVTIALSICAWIIAFLVGSFFGILRTVPNRFLSGLGTLYVELFRNVPLIVQFFTWYLVIPELLPEKIGMWFKAELDPNIQFFLSSMLCLGLFTAARFWRFCPAYCPLPGRRHLPVPVLRKAPGPGLLWQVYVIAYPTPLSSALRTHGYPL